MYEKPHSKEEQPRKLPSETDEEFIDRTGGIHPVTAEELEQIVGATDTINRLNDLDRQDGQV